MRSRILKAILTSWDISSSGINKTLSASDTFDITDTFTDPEIVMLLQRGDLVLTTDDHVLEVIGHDSIIPIDIDNLEDFGDFIQSISDAKDTVRVATTVDLDATYNANTLTLTANNNGAIIQDGISLYLYQRLLVKDQNYLKENGIFFVSVIGDISNPFELTRSQDFNSDFEIEFGSRTTVMEGDTNAKTVWFMDNSSFANLDSDDITFSLSSYFVSYTNLDPSVVTVGGIESGTTFSATTFPYFVDMLLYPELFPTLTNPSSTFSADANGYKEIGEVIASIAFSSGFSRGSITPAYGTSGYRSGLPNKYVYTGTGLPLTQASTSLSDAQTVSSYTVITGAQSWTGCAAYDAGEQPKGSKGTNYSTPLSSGQTSAIPVTITGVYPVFATTVDIATMTKQTLALMPSTIQTNMVAEVLPNKQTADFPDAWGAITGIQFFSTVSNTWEWIGGSKANSLLTFTKTPTTNTIQTHVIAYQKYTHNGSLTGARYLKWYTT